MEGDSLPQETEERLKLVVTAFQVISGEGSHLACQAINEASQTIWKWQHSEYGRQDCMVLLQSDIGPNCTYLVLNVMQLFIRFGFECWDAETVERLGIILKNVLEKYKTGQMRLFDMALRTFCDYLIARDSLDLPFMEALDAPSMLHFWADLCMEATECFWKKYAWITEGQVLPGKCTEITLELLAKNPTSTYWLQIFLFALKFYDNYDAFVVFLPNLLESVREPEGVKMVIEMTPCFYELGLKSENVDVVNAILAFTCKFSQNLRSLAASGAGEYINYLLFCFWQNVLLMDYLESNLPNCLEALGAVIDELLLCLAEFSVDDDVVYKVLKDLWNLLENFVDKKYQGQHPLRNMVVKFFEVCSAIINKGVDPDQFPDTLQNLSAADELFHGYCAQFLRAPAGITPGVLTVVACNLKHLPPEIVRGYADIILSNPRVHQSVFRFIRMLPLGKLDESYMQRFVELVLNCLSTDRVNASASLLGLVQKAHKQLTEFKPDLVSCLASAIPGGPLVTSLLLIGSTLWLLTDCQDQSLFMSICEGVVSYLLNNDVYKPGCSDVERIMAYMRTIRVLVTYCPRVAAVPQHVAQFYNALTLEIIKSLGDRMFLMCTDVSQYQQELCDFISFLLMKQWLTDRSVVGNWLGILFDKGLVISYYCCLLMFVPEIYTRPSIKSFLAEMRPNEDLDFNMATVALMDLIAKNKNFFAFFKIQQLVLYLCNDNERVICQALCVIQDLLTGESLPPGLGEWLFRFLYCSGFDQPFRQRATRGVLVATLKPLAPVCNRDALEAIVRECSPYKDDRDSQFLAAVVRGEPGRTGVQDWYFQIRLDSDAVRIRQSMLSEMFCKE